MSNHLKAGELYAFAANDGSCVVGKVLKTDSDSVLLYMYDRLFEPLSQKADVVAALLEHETSRGYATYIARREFALMYPLWLSQQEVDENEAASGLQHSITISGKRIAFGRNRPYWEPIYIFFFAWLVLFIFFLVICLPNAPFPGSLISAVAFSGTFALPIGGTISFVSVIFRWLEGYRTGISIRTNPTIEFRLPLPFEEAFTKCRDRLGEKTQREFDFVDRRSGYIQSRIQNHLLTRVMCYQISPDETGVIASCFDLKGGTFGYDMWTLKNVVTYINADEGVEIDEKGPLVIGGFLRRFFWFVMTAIFGSVCAMFLKGCLAGELNCVPLVILTSSLALVSGYNLFRRGADERKHS